MKAPLARMEDWSSLDLLLAFAMWAVMMVGMMLPSAAPMILLFSALHRKRREQNAPHVPTLVFLLGYLAVWTAFSGAATLAQWGLHGAALLSPGMALSSPIVGGALLVAAGIYQWTPFKEACLRKCRTPLDFLMTEWREGVCGAVVMGLRHGLFCAGCCALLMGILFVAGVMNLLWVAGVAAFILVEKVAPKHRWTARLSGSGLAAWGLWIAAERWIH